jgi:hypothetical protein
MGNESKKETKEEYVVRRLKEKIRAYNLPENLEKIPRSKQYEKVEYNDNTKDLVDPLSEFYLCKKYFLYFVDNYAYFLDAAKKQVSPLKLFNFQKQLIVPYFLSQQFVIFRKARQVGASVLSGKYALWLANFNIAQDILIVSKTRVDAQDFKAKAMVTYSRLPHFLKTRPTQDGQNMTTLKLTNNSRIITRAQAPDAGRGGSWALVIMDEAAFMPYATEIWSSVYPALSNTNGQCIIISTTNGVGNFYHKTWISAENGENDFYPIYIPWWKFPGRSNPWLDKLENRDIEWIENQLDEESLEKVKEKTKKKTTKLTKKSKDDIYWDLLAEEFISQEEQKQLSYDGPKENKPWLKAQRDNSDSYRTFSQEILAEFLGSGNTVLSPSTLKQIEEMKQDPIREDCLYEDGEVITGLKIYEDPDPAVQYTMTVDVASGAGTDFSTMQVFRDDSIDQVAEYKQQIDTKTFAKFIKQVGRYYNRAYVIIETNQGQSVFNEVYLHETDPYQNVYWELKGKTYRGLHTSPGNKKLMIDEFMYCMENQVIKVHGKRTIEELKVYIWHNGKPEASRGYNDDLVLPVMFLAYLLKYGGQKMKALGFATSDQILEPRDEHEIRYKDALDYQREQEIKEKVEEEFGVDWETYKWLVE